MTTTPPRNDAARPLHSPLQDRAANRRDRKDPEHHEVAMQTASAAPQIWDLDTGLYSRHGLARRARELLSQESRRHGAIACIVVAVQVDAEDTTTVARRCAGGLLATAASSDVVGRLEPRVFAVLAPGTDGWGAAALAERLAAAVRAELVRPGEPPRAVTILVGYDAVTNLRRGRIAPEALLLRATSALPTNGRNDTGGWSIQRFGDYSVTDDSAPSAA